MKKLLLLLMLLIIPISCSAEVFVKGYEPEETARHVEKAMDYFYDKYNLTLNKDIVICVAKDKKEYEEHIKKLGEHTYLAESAYAFAIKTDAFTYILINKESCGDRIWFTLTHELTHAYQFQYYAEPYKSDYALNEGKADLMASEITGYPIKIQDHGISCEEMKDYNGHAKAIVKNGVDKVDEQVRFYANKKQGFFPY